MLARRAFIPEAQRPASFDARPYTVPCVTEHGLTFTSPVTMIVGENGSGKSTLVEAIADTYWYGYFGDATTINRTLMRLDVLQNEVRSVDQQWSVTWVSGIPRLTLATRFARGQINKKSYRATFTRNELGKLVEESQRTFSAGELKAPLQDAVIGAGWIWRGLVIGKL
ncbi:AAA family ATPase [Saccharopolyspora sp. 5N708]|uniref:AAA family ATPase n=1 Tax=Saccharopolyspora sp. 5N708 TaxID=3457424 RepID=UPI003FD4B87C